MLMPRRFLQKQSQLLTLVLNLALGVVPSLAFFGWIERNASLPLVGPALHWPWISLTEESLVLRCLWNVSLFLTFGALHTSLAQARAHRALEGWLPPQVLRTAYLAATGLSLTAVMGLWQNTGILLWVLPLGPLGPLQSTFALHLISALLFWSFMLACGITLSRFDTLHFLGMRQIGQEASELKNTTGNPRLDRTGIFGVIRHPVYSLTLLAILVTPLMSLDRTLLGIAVCLYLAVGIPIEERKLIALFGEAYRTYRNEVPALVPGLTLFKKRLRRLR